MKLPIMVIEKNGDISAYASVAEAEAAMEPIDVENGEYSVTDADGLPLSVVVVNEEVSGGLWNYTMQKTRIIGICA